MNLSKHGRRQGPALFALYDIPAKVLIGRSIYRYWFVLKPLCRSASWPSDAGGRCSGSDHSTGELEVLSYTNKQGGRSHFGSKDDDRFCGCFADDSYCIGESRLLRKREITMSGMDSKVKRAHEMRKYLLGNNLLIQMLGIFT